MTKHLRLIAVLLMLSVLAGFSVVRFAHLLPQPVAESFGLRGDIAEIRERITPQLQTELAEMGLSLGSPIYVRIFKETSELEVWIQDGAQFSHFKTYPICNYSGDLGPKLQEGDRQSPEGFYRVTEASLTPRSRFHLSFNLGFPNQYDRFHGYNGSFLMVHGSCLSVGCYAMTDPAIEEIYVLIETALRAGQNFVPVHAFSLK